MSLIKVYTDVGLKKPVILIAKICKQTKKKYHIKYLSPTDSKYNGKRIYNYESILYEIDDSSISEYLDTDNEKDIGYSKLDDGGGFIKISDVDSDYEPNSSSDDESESESLVDEDEIEDENEDDGFDSEDDDEDDDGEEE